MTIVISAGYVILAVVIIRAWIKSQRELWKSLEDHLKSTPLRKEDWEDVLK